MESLKKILTMDGLITTLKNYYEKMQSAVDCRYNVFDSTPTSFIIEVGVEDCEEYVGLFQRYKEISQNIYYKEKLPAKHCKHNMWLVKPANLNQGIKF